MEPRVPGEVEVVTKGLPEQMYRAIRWLVQSRYGLLLAGMGGLLLLGLAILQDFGTSVDEWHNAFYGELFLRTYETGNLLKSPGIDYFNGPFYFMLFTPTTTILRSLNPSWLPTDARHVTNLLTFLGGLFFFYRLSLRLLSRPVSLFLCALFASQPVLFGHAFINQKDIPLMAFFVASVELGLVGMGRVGSPHPRLHDSHLETSGSPKSRRLPTPWLSWSNAHRAAWAVSAAIVGLALLDLWGVGLGRALSMHLLENVYLGRGPALLQDMFARVATDAYKTPLASYLAKLNQAYFWARLAVTPVLLVTAFALVRMILPSRAVRSVDDWLRRVAPLVAAGVVLGMTTSIRLAGPLAGVLVAGYGWRRGGVRMVPAILLYACVGAVTTYLTWPALWGNPLGAFLDRAAMDNGFAQTEVFFLGTRYESTALPAHYLPTLLAVQLTLPVVALFLVGAPASWLTSRGDPERTSLVGLAWVWLLIPLGVVVAGLVPVYDNFRHELFVLPALFLIVGIGVAYVGTRIRPTVLRLAMACLALVPGIAGIVRLHPYEYIYYNEIVGGVQGAKDRFELDYWCIAFREVMGFVGQAAPPEARVGFAGGILSASPFAREDLQLFKPDGRSPEPDLAVSGCRLNARPDRFYSWMDTVYEVRADGVVIAIVRHKAD